MQKSIPYLMIICLAAGYVGASLAEDKNIHNLAEVAATAKKAASHPAATELVTTTIEAAVAVADQANALGHEWRDTRKLIKKAQQAAADGETEQALTLARQAQLQGEAAVQQALSQQEAGPRF